MRSDLTLCHVMSLLLVVASFDINGIKMVPVHSLHHENQNET